MFRLTRQQLDAGLRALNQHGYGSFFPPPPELGVINRNWTAFRQTLESVDLDQHACREPLSLFAPKSRLNVRFVSLLHPADLLLYTSLVLALRDDIAAARVPLKARRVFSFRSERASHNVLYDDRKGGFRAFKQRIRERLHAKPHLFLGTADIADFYNRVYQHRIINAIDACANGKKKSEVRVLEKLLAQFSGGVSYGIPVGPAASRVLGEAVLVDVDSALLSERIDFVRFADDFVFLGARPESVESAIHFLGEVLFKNHGLTLQAAKTEVFTGEEYANKYLSLPADKEVARRALRKFINEFGYELPPYDQMKPHEQAAVNALNLSEMLQESLQGAAVDFVEVSFILSRLSALQRPDLIPIVLPNLRRLFPVAHSVAAFFGDFTDLSSKLRRRIAQHLLRPLEERTAASPDYYAIWVLDVMRRHRAWNHADLLLRLYRMASPIRKRYLALALAVCGDRAHVLQIKEDIHQSPPLLRTAILYAGNRLGDDERKFWRRSLRLTDRLEQLVEGAP